MIKWFRKLFKRDKYVIDLESIRPDGTPICTYSKNGEEINTIVLAIANKVKF